MITFDDIMTRRRGTGFFKFLGIKVEKYLGIGIGVFIKITIFGECVTVTETEVLDVEIEVFRMRFLTAFKIKAEAS